MFIPPMAMTFGFAVLGVVILCLTYIPMMAALFLQPPKTDKKNMGAIKLLVSLKKIYTPVIGWSLKRSWIVITIAFVLLVSGGFLFTRMGAEFIPKLDEGDFAFQAFLKPGTSLTEVTKTSTRLEQIVLENFPPMKWKAFKAGLVLPICQWTRCQSTLQIYL